MIEPKIPAEPAETPRARRTRKPAGLSIDRIPNTRPSSANQPHRSVDAYHGSYNDYLWHLAMADGATPSVPTPRIGESNPGDAPDSGDPVDGANQMRRPDGE